MERNCQSCRYYRAFYMKGYLFFYKEKAGFCSARQQAVSKDEVCKAHRRRLPAKKTVSAEQIEDAIEDVKELKRIYPDD